ncbi:MAG: hypothetical protein JWP75_166 [Frondihabitans sp.]|nr:hypothetical protein [Frondihabitans sp.]
MTTFRASAPVVESRRTPRSGSLWARARRIRIRALFGTSATLRDQLDYAERARAEAERRRLWL